jgi:2-hydroxychromene-2-carboxylate isomerase
MAEIEYFYSAHSAFAYIGDRRLHEIAREAGARIVHRPFDLRRLMSATGGAANSMTPERRAYFSRREIERWAAFRGLEIMRGIPESHPNDFTLANRVLIAAAEAGADVDNLAFAIMQAHWRDGADLADAAGLARIGEGAGIAMAPLLEAAASDHVAAIHEANTQAAIARPMFGSPTYIVAGDMFYGQDHLELVARALSEPFPDTWPRD